MFPADERGEEEEKNLFLLFFFVVMINSLVVDMVLFCRIISYMRHNAVLITITRFFWQNIFEICVLRLGEGDGGAYDGGGAVQDAQHRHGTHQVSLNSFRHHLIFHILSPTLFFVLIAC